VNAAIVRVFLSSSVFSPPDVAPSGRRRVVVYCTGSTSGREFTAWNGLTFNFVIILQAHDVAIRTLTFNHAGTYITFAGQSGIVRYLKNQHEQPHRMACTTWSVFSPDHARFAAASDHSMVEVWSLAESREERILTSNGWDVKCVEWHPEMGLLVSGSKDNLIKIWNSRTGTALMTLQVYVSYSF